MRGTAKSKALMATGFRSRPRSALNTGPAAAGGSERRLNVKPACYRSRRRSLRLLRIPNYQPIYCSLPELLQHRKLKNNRELKNNRDMFSRRLPVEVEEASRAPPFGGNIQQHDTAGCAGRRNLQPLRRQIFDQTRAQAHNKE